MKVLWSSPLFYVRQWEFKFPGEALQEQPTTNSGPPVPLCRSFCPSLSLIAEVVLPGPRASASTAFHMGGYHRAQETAGRSPQTWIFDKFSESLEMAVQDDVDQADDEARQELLGWHSSSGHDLILLKAWCGLNDGNAHVALMVVCSMIALFFVWLLQHSNRRRMLRSSDRCLHSSLRARTRSVKAATR